MLSTSIIILDKQKDSEYLNMVRVNGTYKFEYIYAVGHFYLITLYFGVSPPITPSEFLFSTPLAVKIGKITVLHQVLVHLSPTTKTVINWPNSPSS